METGLKRFEDYLTTAGLDAKPHQKTGVEWCLRNELNGHKIGNKVVRGGLVADEMGLGKTIQALGVVIGNFKINPGTLIVVPRALLDQWFNTIVSTLGHEPLLFHGSNKPTRDDIQRAPIVLTTYGHISIKKDGPKRLLHELKWGRVIFDEAHHLRNKKTSTHMGALQLEAEIRWLITGTPIQKSSRRLL